MSTLTTPAKVTATFSTTKLAETYQEFRSKAAGMDRDACFEWLRDIHLIKTNAVLATAAVFSRLLELGVNIEEIRMLGSDEYHFYKRVADGLIVPGVLERFGNSKVLLKRVSALDPKTQQTLADGGRIKFVEITPSGETTHRMVDPLIHLKKRQLADQVFDGDKIRNEEQQIAWLAEQRVATATAKPEKIGELEIDYERGGVKVGRYFIPQHDLVAAANLLKK